MQKKKGKKERELEKQKAEKELSRIEEALMDPGRQPESADDFDRLVLSSPDSSILWLQYMAFHLQATEIEKARAVAERALKTISFRSGLRLFTLSLLTEFATMVHFFLDRLVAVHGLSGSSCKCGHQKRITHLYFMVLFDEITIATFTSLCVLARFLVKTSKAGRARHPLGCEPILGRAGVAF